MDQANGELKFKNGKVWNGPVDIDLKPHGAGKLTSRGKTQDISFNHGREITNGDGDVEMQAVIPAANPNTHKCITPELT